LIRFGGFLISRVEPLGFVANCQTNQVEHTDECQNSMSHGRLLWFGRLRRFYQKSSWRRNAAIVDFAANRASGRMVGVDENPYKSPSVTEPVPLKPPTGSKLATTLVLDWATTVGIIILIFCHPTTLGGQVAVFAILAAVVLDATWACGRLVRSFRRNKKSKW